MSHPDIFHSLFDFTWISYHLPRYTFLRVKKLSDLLIYSSIPVILCQLQISLFAIFTHHLSGTSRFSADGIISHAPPQPYDAPRQPPAPHGKYSPINVGQSVGRMTSTRPEWRMPPTEVLLQALESNTRGIVMMRRGGGGGDLCVFRNDIPLSLWRRSMNNQHWNPGVFGTMTPCCALEEYGIKLYFGLFLSEFMAVFANSQCINVPLIAEKKINKEGPTAAWLACVGLFAWMNSSLVDHGTLLRYYQLPWW